jgi:hypothetical protein
VRLRAGEREGFRPAGSQRVRPLYSGPDCVERREAGGAREGRLPAPVATASVSGDVKRQNRWQRGRRLGASEPTGSVSADLETGSVSSDWKTDSVRTD